MRTDFLHVILEKAHITGCMIPTFTNLILSEESSIGVALLHEVGYRCKCLMHKQTYKCLSRSQPSFLKIPSRPAVRSQDATILCIRVNGPFPESSTFQIRLPASLIHLHSSPGDHCGVVDAERGGREDEVEVGKTTSCKKRAESVQRIISRVLRITHWIG